MPNTRARCGLTGGRCVSRSPRDARARGIGMVHQELVGRARPERGRERAISAPSRCNRLGLVDWRAMRAERGRASRAARHRRRSARADGRLAARACSSSWNSRACCFPARASSSWTSRPRRCRRPRWSGCSACCAGCARRGQKHRVHLAFSRRCAGDLRPRHGVPQRPRSRDRGRRARIDKRWIIERMIGAGHEELEESYTGDIPLHSRPDAKVVLEVDGPEPRGRVSGRVAAGARRRGAGHLRVHGLGPAGTGAHAVRQAAGRSGGRLRMDGRRSGCASRADARGAPAWPSCRRAGASMLFAHRAGVQERVDQRSSTASIVVLAAAGRGARDRARACRAACSIRPPHVSIGRLAPCPAATSRKSRWRSG